MRCISRGKDLVLYVLQEDFCSFANRSKDLLNSYYHLSHLCVFFKLHCNQEEPCWFERLMLSFALLGLLPSQIFLAAEEPKILLNDIFLTSFTSFIKHTGLKGLNYFPFLAEIFLFSFKCAIKHYAILATQNPFFRDFFCPLCTLSSTSTTGNASRSKIKLANFKIQFADPLCCAL